MSAPKRFRRAFCERCNKHQWHAYVEPGLGDGFAEYSCKTCGRTREIMKEKDHA